MADANNGGLGAGIAVEDRLPVQWSPLEARTSATSLQRLAEQNQEVLRVIYTLDGGLVEANEDHFGGIKGLVDLDFKVNTLLDLVGYLVTQQLPMPATKPVHLGSGFLHWEEAGTPPQAGQAIVITLYLSMRYPRAVDLPSTVEQVEAREAGYQVQASFQHLGEEVTAWLEKLIFRHHRRQIAQTRHSPRP